MNQRELTEDQSEMVLQLLVQHQLMSQREAEAFAYGLLHVAQSMRKIYGEIIPGMLHADNRAAEYLDNAVHEIREEFRHIDYHMEDGKLTYL